MRRRGGLELLLPELDEKARRLTLGAVARAAGDGGIGAVAKLTGASWQTVANGAAELGSGQVAPGGRVRRAGAGRPKLAETDPGLVPALLALVQESVRGDPESPLLWTTKSAVHLAGELTRQGHACSPQTAWRLLREQGFSTQSNAKVTEGKRHPDRDAQFRYISQQAREHLAAAQPVISVDAKKKEQVGQYAQAGREWRPRGDPVRVRDHSFADRESGHAIPYGIYDVAANTGFVAALAQETGLEITCCHFPPGTSKWNQIEHRLFSQITLAWRGRPLTSYDVILSTIAAVTTRTGLAVTAVLDGNPCPAGVQVSDEQIKDIEDRHLTRHEFHGEWNYAFPPVPRPAPDPQPEPEPLAPAGLCDPAVLNHPALTGLDPAALDALAAALEAPFRGWREQRRYARAGRPRARTGREGGWNRKLGTAGHLIAARLRAHLNLPVKVTGALLGIDATTVSHATSRTASILAGLPPGRLPPAAPPPAIRLQTLDDLRQYAARHGITISQAPPAARTPPTDSTVQAPDTPRTHLNLE